MIKDISTFINKKNDKFDLEVVHIKEKDGNLYAVATDGARLVEYKITDESLTDMIKQDNIKMFDAKVWSDISKASKKDIGTHLITLAELIATNKIRLPNQDRRKLPDYERITPKEEEFIQSNFDFKIDLKYLKDFLELIKTNDYRDKADVIDFSKIKQAKDMLFYKNDELMVMLMYRL